MNKKLPTHIFIVTQILILVISLSLITGLYYPINIQYQKPKSQLLQGGPVTTLPHSLVLEVDQPDDNSLVFQPSAVISGATSAGSTVLISSDLQDITITPKLNGSYSTVINLKTGINQVSVYAFDKTGDQRLVTRTIYYSKEKIWLEFQISL